MSRTVLFHEYGGPEVLTLADAPPGEPGAGEALVRVDAIGLNRAEALFRSGRYIEPVRRFPARLGLEAAGAVEALGPGVTGLRVGDEVSVLPVFSQNDHGVYAERAVVPAAALVRRPAGLDAEAGAAVWMPYLTAYGGLVEVGGLRPGDAVVLTAASSGVGLAALRVAERVGATAIAVTRTAAKRDALLREGAAEVVVSGEEDVAGRVLEITGGRGVPLVFDAVAGPGVRDLARVVAPGGTLLLYGMSGGEATPYPAFEPGVPALNMRTYTLPETVRDPERGRRAVAFVTAGLRSGAFRPAVDPTRFELDGIADAHRYMEQVDARVGKIVVSVDH
ncbi:L-threonine 3-dehydrogenase [Nocardiopsis dassonvillei]|uniref:zinc-dependent alcohol dehydrogenase family protein n=1 Tax=Nocardiopsis dassonvillei TaxID=2014 RepID=UPI003F55C3C7